MTIIRKNKMFALTNTHKKGHVITTVEGILCVYPSYEDARIGATKDEKVIPVMVTIETVPNNQRFFKNNT